MSPVEAARNETLVADTSGPSLPAHSIRRRYLATLISQGMQLLISALTASLVPRALGPASFGNYSFILNMAASLRNFTDLGTHQTFFTFSSKEPATGALTRLYGLWLLIQLALSIGLILGSQVFGVTALIWPGPTVDQILMVTALEWLIYVALLLRQLGDTKGLTVHSQALSALATFLSAAGLLYLGISGRLTFYSYVAWLTAATLVTCLGLSLYLLKVHAAACWTGNMRLERGTYLARWKVYASPLVIYGFYSVIVSALDTYLIQRLYGSSEQAFFSLSLRWSSMVMLFTTSVLTIYWRELTHSLASGNRARARDIYVRFNHVLFFLAVLLGTWLCCNAPFVIQTLAGPAYAAAIPVLMVMAFYPVQQTFGQLNSTAFLASERTRQYKNLGILLSIPHLLLTYLLLAPRHARIPGLELGAMGVALKMVAFGLITVQVYAWLNARFFQISYARALWDKLRTVGFVGLCAAVAFFGVGAWTRAEGSLGYGAITALTSAVYFALAVFGTHRWPQLAGVSRADWAPIERVFKNL